MAVSLQSFCSLFGHFRFRGHFLFCIINRAEFCAAFSVFCAGWAGKSAAGAAFGPRGRAGGKTVPCPGYKGGIFLFASVISGAVCGIESRLISVEVDISNGLPGFSMVGYLSSEVKEAQERVRAALHNSGINPEPRKVTVNLSPADIRKAGSGFDLPVAVAMLTAYGYIPEKAVSGIFFAGELSLNGKLRGIHGILGMVGEAKLAGCHSCIIPAANVREGAVIQGIRVYGADDLDEVVRHLCGTKMLEPYDINIEEIFQNAINHHKENFSDIKGQETVRRAAEIAAAGRHNLLISGPPGTGKSMIARRIPSILPPMTLDESLEVSRIHSVAGILPEEGILGERPFRMPHHTVSAAGLAGGGTIPRPGEISLAHKGVLYLDELPEFQKETLEILRQPLEDREVTITRNSGTYVFPSDFILVASRNPCKCGYYPDRTRCRCSEGEVRRYLHRISRPLLDRIDLHVCAGSVTYEDLKDETSGESSEDIRKRVLRAHKIQTERYAACRYRFNGELPSEAVAKYCRLDEEGEKLMRSVFVKKRLTARTYHRILKVARTIADLEGEENILIRHLSEAVCYRPEE